MREPLRVRVEDERQALALARELVGLPGLDVHVDDGSWEVTIDDVATDRLVVRVLDGVRRALAGEPEATALVRLDGREYRLQGE